MMIAIKPWLYSQSGGGADNFDRKCNKCHGKYDDKVLRDGRFVSNIWHLVMIHFSYCRKFKNSGSKRGFFALEHIFKKFLYEKVTMIVVPHLRLRNSEMIFLVSKKVISLPLEPVFDDSSLTLQEPSRVRRFSCNQWLESWTRVCRIEPLLLLLAHPLQRQIL